MQLTLNQFLFLVMTIAVVVAVTFLVTLFIQLKKTAKEGEETLVEIKSLVRNLSETSLKAREKIDEVDETLQAVKKTANRLAQLTWFMTTRFYGSSSKYWPFAFPLIRLGWRLWKKRKEKNNVT
jgi:predicted PurR-regulated permease PerM